MAMILYQAVKSLKQQKNITSILHQQNNISFNVMSTVVWYTGRV